MPKRDRWPDIMPKVVTSVIDAGRFTLAAKSARADFSSLPSPIRHHYRAGLIRVLMGIPSTVAYHGF